MTDDKHFLRDIFRIRIRTNSCVFGFWKRNDSKLLVFQLKEAHIPRKMTTCSSKNLNTTPYILAMAVSSGKLSMSELWCNRNFENQVVYEWADKVGWRSLSIKISYSEPTWAQSREETSIIAESSRVFLGDVKLDFDWLTKFKGFSCSILIGCRQFFGFRHNPSVFGNVLR